MVLTRVLGNPPLTYEATGSQPAGMTVFGEMAHHHSLETARMMTAEARELRLAKIRALRGKYADIGISSDDFLRMKYELKDRY